MDVLDDIAKPPSADITCRSFFDHFCPLLLKNHEAQVKKLGGRLGFCILGPNGGVWLVDLNTATVTHNPQGQADVNFSALENDFNAILKGEADVVRLLEEKKIFITGNPNVLKGFGELMTWLSSGT